MKKQTRRQFIESSIVTAGMAAALPQSIIHAASSQTGQQSSRKEPIVEHFKGDFSGYIPPMIGNGDLGGSFDPFCGTWFDELRSVPDQKEDIRSLLQAKFIAQDFWEETHLDPHKHPLTEESRQGLLEAKPGWLTSSSITRGSPFDLFIGPAEKEFPAGVDDHVQRLDIEEGLLSSEYSFQGKEYRVECFVHPSLSLLAYRVQAGGPVQFRIKPSCVQQVSAEERMQLLLTGYGTGRAKIYGQGDALFAESYSNIYSPAVAAVYSERGRREGDGILLPPGESTLFVAYGHTSLRNPKKQIAAVLAEVRGKGYDVLRRENTQWWADFWERSDISIPDARMQQMYYRSLYYIGASLARKTKTPCFEAGISGSYPSFQTGYHIQDSVYHVWPMINSNHLELAEPMLEWFLDVLPVAKEIARSQFWLEGARYIWHGGPGMLPFIPGHTHYGCCSLEHHVNGWVVFAIERYLDACGWDKDKSRRYYPVVSEIARFFSAMLSPRGNGYDIPYLPSHSQSESTDTVDKPNCFDVLASAKWCLQVAANMSRLLGMDVDEGRRWQREAAGIDFSILQRPDGAYALFEGDEGVRSKICTQFMGVIFPIGLKKDVLLKTYSYIQEHVIFGCCSWDPGYAAVSLARLRETELAINHFNRIFKENYTEEPWIMFRESAPFWLKSKKGNMPYYLAAHGLYAQAIHEMLVQNWTGKVECFPACPFEQASFRLRVGNEIIPASKAGKSISST